MEGVRAWVEILSYLEKGLQDYKQLPIINIEQLIIQWFKAVLRWKHSQNTRNYDAIQIRDPQILNIFLKLDQLISQFNFTIKF